MRKRHGVVLSNEAEGTAHSGAALDVFDPTGTHAHAKLPRAIRKRSPSQVIVRVKVNGNTERRAEVSGRVDFRPPSETRGGPDQQSRTSCEHAYDPCDRQDHGTLR